MNNLKIVLNQDGDYSEEGKWGDGMETSTMFMLYICMHIYVLFRKLCDGHTNPLGLLSTKFFVLIQQIFTEYLLYN